MSGIFDYIPQLIVVLFVVGLIGVIVYERAKTRLEERTTD